MRKWQIPWGFFGLLLILAVLTGTLGAFRLLWVFPLDAKGLPLWMVICALDLLLQLSAFSFSGNARLLLWCGGLLFFTARQDVPGVGLALILTSAALWVSARLRLRYMPLIAALIALLLVLGHQSSRLQPGVDFGETDFRFSLHLISVFLLLRMLAWLKAVEKRGERPGFLVSMEYFLSPVFWLSPMHASFLLFRPMRAAEASISKEESFGWLVRGFVHAGLFSLLATYALPYLEQHFRAGFFSFCWWEWGLLGPLLFALSYLETSRVSYLVAGCLSLGGRSIRPDFHSPWKARNLLDFWRRFHSWRWEYYFEMVYLPLSRFLALHFSSRRAAILALFLTLALGTSLVNWLRYPAPLISVLGLGILLGLFSLFHRWARPWLRLPFVGVSVTWLSVFFLYALAYPAFVFGWGAEDYLNFFRR